MNNPARIARSVRAWWARERPRPRIVAAGLLAAMIGSTELYRSSRIEELPASLSDIAESHEPRRDTQPEYLHDRGRVDRIVAENTQTPANEREVEAHKTAMPIARARTPVFMYHRIGATEDRFTVSPSRLEAHLDALRTRGYALATYGEYAQAPREHGRAVLTFDDSTQGQFRFLSDGSIDPTCAVGILERYQFAHPSWRVTATFFVNTNTDTGGPFEQQGLERLKLAYLARRGYEIGVHGDKHLAYATLSQDQVGHDLDRFAMRIEDLLPEYTLTSFAYPYGSIPSVNGQTEVESRYPWTAHAWGGVAQGERRNTPRIEVGPRTDITEYLVRHEANIYK